MRLALALSTAALSAQGFVLSPSCATTVQQSKVLLGKSQVAMAAEDMTSSRAVFDDLKGKLDPDKKAKKRKAKQAKRMKRPAAKGIGSQITAKAVAEPEAPAVETVGKVVEVVSWYDSGVRLTAEEPAVEAPKVEVVSWYDSGVRLTAEEPAVEAPKVEVVSWYDSGVRLVAEAAEEPPALEEEPVAEAPVEAAPAVAGSWTFGCADGEHPKTIELSADGSVEAMPFHGVGGSWKGSGDDVSFDITEEIFSAGQYMGTAHVTYTGTLDSDGAIAGTSSRGADFTLTKD